MKKKEKYGILIILVIGLIYVFVQLNLKHSISELTGKSVNNSTAYNNKIEKQKSINKSIEKAIVIRYENPGKSIQIIDSLISATYNTKEISECILSNYKLRFIIESGQVHRAKDQLKEYQNLCRNRSIESNLVDAVIQFEEGKTDEAINRLEIAKKKKVEYSWYLGNLYEQLKETDKAKSENEWLVSRSETINYLSQDRINKMDSKPPNNFLYLDDLSMLKFFNIKPLFYEGQN